MRSASLLLPLVLLAGCAAPRSGGVLPAPPPVESGHPALLDPAQATETAPEAYRVRFTTSRGPFVVEVNRPWAPRGADRLYNMVKIGYFQNVAFFRAIEGFMVQFGLHGRPEVNAAWREAKIPDDPVSTPNAAGTLTFATSGPDSRTTQLFLNLVDNPRLDGMGFSPVGKVVEGMDVVRSLFTGYGEGAPRGEGPSQELIHARGNDYLAERFPKLDYIQSAELLE